MRALLGLLFIATVGWARDIRHAKPEDVNTNIVNGIDAFPGQFPFIAYIKHEAGFDCIGALITPEWVVSVASCIGNGGYPPSEYTVVLGLYDYEDFGNGGRPETYQIQYVIPHSGYSNPNSDFNLSLIRLAQPVQPYNPFIQTVALAPDNDYDYLDANCFIAGWGIRSTTGPFNRILQYHPAPVITAEECEIRSSFSRSTRMCIYNGITGTCVGDLGAPLVCRRDGITYLAGVASNTPDKCLEMYPSLFTRISFHNPWIKVMINRGNSEINKSLDTNAWIKSVIE